jgi:hypothetical protein
MFSKVSATPNSSDTFMTASRQSATAPRGESTKTPNPIAKTSRRIFDRVSRAIEIRRHRHGNAHATRT